ncbi:MAG TPA: hypothetical protein VKE70_20670 [Candidatus Solibacter sp.]|nr:hypothetical protein [Candidatus Solibacter sp.]
MNSRKYRITRLSVAAAMAVTPAICLSLRAASNPAPGEQRQWSLAFKVQLEQPGDARPIEIGITGELVATISGVRSGEYDAQFEIRSPHVTGGRIGGASQAAIDQLERRLARPFWLTRRDDGALLAIHFFKDVSASDRNLLQMVATEIQFLRPNKDENHWTVLERDGGGSYLALYQRQGANALLKHKLKYVDTDGGPGTQANSLHIEIDQSDVRLALDSLGGIAALDATNRWRVGAPSGQMAPLTIATETHLSNFRKGYTLDGAGSLLRARPDVESSPIVTHRADPDQLRAERDAGLLEGRTTESLLRAAAERAGDAALSERLAGLFRRRSGAAKAAVAFLRKNGACPRITDALATAGSPDALEALAMLARDGALPRSQRIDALTAFIPVQRPGVEAMMIPGRLLDDQDARVATAARMSSGALAHAGRAEHPAAADAIDRALIACYRKATGAQDVVDVLSALGNSVGPLVLPVIRDALRDPRVPVRAAAVRGLRLAPGDEVDRLLSARITSDDDSSVRSAALFAVSFRNPLGPTLAEALLRAARADPVDLVRSSSISLLRQNPSASPRVEETLAWIADHDSQPGIRRLAREAVASIARRSSE